MNELTVSNEIYDEFNPQHSLDGTFASTFKNRGMAMTTDELRKARETRAADALRMKDEQLRILSEQNANLLKTLDKVFSFFIRIKMILTTFSWKKKRMRSN